MGSNRSMTRRETLQLIAVTSSSLIVGCQRTPAEMEVPAVEQVPMQEIGPLAASIPLLRRLHEIDAAIKIKFPRKYDPGLGHLGLLLSSELKNEGYWCTPTNSLRFAETGGDGVHFSLVQVNGGVGEDSPVVMTVPQNFGEKIDANIIVGSSLLDFLRFGLRRGYFAMEQLAYQRDLTLHVYSTPNWQPTEQGHRSAGFDVDEHKHQVLAYLVTELNVTPLAYTKAEFETMQKRCLAMLQFGPA